MARSAVPGGSSERWLLIPLGYFHPGKCKHREVQSHSPLCNGRSTFVRMRESSLISKLWRTIMKANTEGLRKVENEDKNDCIKLQKTPKRKTVFFIRKTVSFIISKY